MWGKNPVGATLYKLKLILYEKFGFCMEAPQRSEDRACVPGGVFLRMS